MSSALAERLLAALPAATGADAAAARAAFAAAGLPDRKVESWRYSTLGGMETLDPAAGFVDALALPELGGVSGTLAEFVGGRHVCIAPPDGVTLSIGAAVVPAADRLETGKAARAQAFRWLAEAGAAEELVVDVTAPVSGAWRLAWQHDAAGLVQSRCRVRVRRGASITLVEHHLGPDGAAGLANRLLDIEIEEGGELTWIRVQECGAKAQSVQHSDLRIATGGRCAMVALELGGLWSRHTLSLVLAGADARVQLVGLVALQGRQHHDTQLALTHTVGGAQSRTLWKAIANQRARSVFNGLITVAPGADQTLPVVRAFGLPGLRLSTGSTTNGSGLAAGGWSCGFAESWAITGAASRTAAVRAVHPGTRVGETGFIPGILPDLANPGQRGIAIRHAPRHATNTP